MSEHTKGPWEILTLDGKIPAIRKILSSVGEADKFSATVKVANIGPPFEIICVLDFGYGKSEDEANACLIAATPELLAAVRAGVAYKETLAKFGREPEGIYHVGDELLLDDWTEALAALPKHLKGNDND